MNLDVLQGGPGVRQDEGLSGLERRVRLSSAEDPRVGWWLGSAFLVFLVSGVVSWNVSA